MERTFTVVDEHVQKARIPCRAQVLGNYPCQDFGEGHERPVGSHVMPRSTRHVCEARQSSCSRGTGKESNGGDASAGLRSGRSWYFCKIFCMNVDCLNGAPSAPVIEPFVSGSWGHTFPSIKQQLRGVLGPCLVRRTCRCYPRHLASGRAPTTATAAMALICREKRCR